MDHLQLEAQVIKNETEVIVKLVLNNEGKGMTKRKGTGIMTNSADVT